VVNSNAAYLEADSPRLAIAVRTFTRKSIEGGVMISGKCPECDHEFTQVIILRPQLITPGRSVSGQSVTRALTDAPPKHLIRCACTELHEGRPEAHLGCGAMAFITIGRRQ
jgi:hypothetical protein